MNSHADNKPDIVKLDDVSMIRDHRTILRDVNLTVKEGDFVAITGPNGGGKTTLLRIILGLLKPTHGTVHVKSGATIGYLPQKNQIDSHFPLSVGEVVESGLLSCKNLSRAERETRTQEILKLVGMNEHKSRPIGELSGGQLQRTLLGRAIISEPELLVLDEPLSYLDKRFEGELYSLVAKIAERSTILLVSHEMTAISGMANRHLIIDVKLHECTAEHHFVKTDCDE